MTKSGCQGESITELFWGIWFNFNHYTYSIYIYNIYYLSLHTFQKGKQPFWTRKQENLKLDLICLKQELITPWFKFLKLKFYSSEEYQVIGNSIPEPISTTTWTRHSLERPMPIFKRYLALVPSCSSADMEKKSFCASEMKLQVDNNIHWRLKFITWNRTFGFWLLNLIFHISWLLDTVSLKEIGK